MATTTVIFDLFGTLVAAPSAGERSAAARAMADAVGATQESVESYLQNSWLVRHDGTLPNVSALAAHLQASIGQQRPARPVVDVLKQLAVGRIEPDRSVSDTLRRLREVGLKIGLISDASAEIAEAWPKSSLAPLVDHAVFSCTAKAIKPAASLYAEVLHQLGAVPDETIYLGDGGGDELRGAQARGICAIGVRRRGGEHTLAYGTRWDWRGPSIDSIESIEQVLSTRSAGLKAGGNIH